VQRGDSAGRGLVTAQETGDKEGTTILAPIRKGDRVIGVLFIQRRQSHSYTARDVETLQTLSDQCGGALQRVQVRRNCGRASAGSGLVRELAGRDICGRHAGRVLDVNRAGACCMAMTREELVGSNSIEKLVPPERRGTAREEFRKLRRGNFRG